MPRLSGGDLDLADPGGFPGRQLRHRCETLTPKELTHTWRPEHRHVAADPAQRGQVGVVVVKVGDQHGIEAVRQPRRRGCAVAAQRSDPAAQHGIGEQPGAAELHEDCCVANVGDFLGWRHFILPARCVGSAAYRPPGR
jgi:hypothetical protein